MGRIYFGAKAKAWTEERKARESEAIQRASDNESIVPVVPRQIGQRPRRNHAIVSAVKADKQQCEHCEWKPPPNAPILHAHHVIPMACGGLDHPDNMIVLCPNCHAIAHYVAKRTNLTRTYSGPRTAQQLRVWMWAAESPSRLRALQYKHRLDGVAHILASMRA